MYFSGETQLGWKKIRTEIARGRGVAGIGWGGGLRELPRVTVGVFYQGGGAAGAGRHECTLCSEHALKFVCFTRKKSFCILP